MINLFSSNDLEKTIRRLTQLIFSFTQISDIVIGQEDNISAREALLRWARKSTARYPGVRVNDFTASWRDGLAFSALIHRNRPDLIDWRDARQKRVRERLETVFSIAETNYGVTRLLDAQGESFFSTFCLVSVFMRRSISKCDIRSPKNTT